jgi:hypothetical protein
MNASRRTVLAGTAVTALMAVSFGATAQAAPPKKFTKTVDFTDATPDPSGNAGAGNEDHCTGQLPREEPITLKLPAPGTLDIQLGGFQGDWALQLLEKGEIIGGDDVNPPAYEASSIRFKKATTVQILPCNLAGTPQGTVTYTFTPKK